jgi:hypothetical protein
MNRQKWILAMVALLLMGGTGIFLARHHPTLGRPGVKTHDIPGSIRLQVDLPEQVLDYASELVPMDAITTNSLPQDTSFGQRHYQSQHPPFRLDATVVLMGTDRASMHKPQFCLEGQGYHIFAQSVGSVHIDKPVSYDLPVVKLLATREGVDNRGQRVAISGVYVYWFVAEDGLSASVSGFERMWMLAWKMLRSGILQRWAYVSCFAACTPGQEDATYERMKQFIAASVPQFQLYPRPAQAPTATR